MQMEMVMRLLLLTGEYLKIAMFGMRVGDARRISSALTVRNQYLVTYAVSQHPHTVPALFLRECLLRFYIRTIEKIHG